MKSRFRDCGKTTDGVTIQIRVPGPHDGGWYLVTVSTEEGNLISVSCDSLSDAEQAAKWMEQYSTAEIPGRMAQRQGPYLYNLK